MPPQLDFFWPEGLIFWCHIFLPFHTVHGVLVARILEWIAFPPPVGHILSELFTVTYLSWVTLQGMTHKFIKLHEPLHKVVINEERYECTTIYFVYLWIFKLHCFAFNKRCVAVNLCIYGFICMSMLDLHGRGNNLLLSVSVSPSGYCLCINHYSLFSCFINS